MTLSKKPIDTTASSESRSADDPCAEPSPARYGGTCRAAVFLGANQPLQLREFPIPLLHPHEALVAIECSTICGSDLHTVKGLRQECCPSILGHEAIGSVVDLGDPPLTDTQGVSLRVGDRVTWSTVVACGTCDRCYSGLPQKCRSLSKYGHDIAEGRTALCGGLADYLLLRKGSAVVKIDAHLPAEVVCPANCATATVACAMRYADPIAGARVLIIGAGMLGLTAAAMAKTLQAREVTVVDTLPARLEIAKRFGADHVLLWEPESEAFRSSLVNATGAANFDALFEFSGSSLAVAAAIDACDIGGRVVLVGTVMPSPTVALNPEAVVRRCMSIRGVHNYAAQDLETAIRFLSQTQQRYPFADLVEKTFALADSEAAISYAFTHRPIRTAVRP
jgi:threonine 3-dehydrogenase